MEEDNRTFKIMKSLVIVIVSIVIASLACFLILREKISESIMNEIYETTNEESISYKESVIREAEEMNLLLDTFEKILLKNSDWTNLKLSKKFVKNYNQDNGILGDKNVDWVELDWRTKNNEKQIVAFIHDDKQVDYYYFAYLLNEKGELDDVIIKEIYNYKDENGDEIEHESLMIEDNYIMNLIILARPKFRIWEDSFLNREKVAVTDNYISKYDINNGFLDDPYFVNNYIDMKSCDYNNRYVVMFAEYPDRTEKISIIFFIDDKLRLDDLKFSIDEVIEITGEEKVKREERFLNEYGYSYEERYNNTQPFINY